MFPEETLKYILSFLVGKDFCQLIGYTDDKSLWKQYDIVIRPSIFFDKNIFLTNKSLPKENVDSINGVPILFGTNSRAEFGRTTILDADFIASTFFLISRYEELINSIRDVHGRFCAKDSVAYRYGFLQRPIVDEYGKILRDILRQKAYKVTENKGFSKIFLTHDADKLTQYRNLRGFLGGIFRSAKKFSLKSISSVFKSVTKGALADPLFTFDELLRLDETVDGAQSIVFVKAGDEQIGFDHPMYNLKSSDAQTLFDICAKHKCIVGLHSSYRSGECSSILKNEKKRLESALNKTITFNRYHFLRTCNTDDMKSLAEIGISDDFTLGYADIAGFRLGTCRAVKWINPKTKQLTSITLHPLSIMDCSLSEQKYMGLSYEQAVAYCSKIIQQIREYNGEIVFLWHNSEFSTLSDSYHRKLYGEIIKML